MASDQQQTPCHEYDDAVEKLENDRLELEAAQQEFREASDRLEAARLSLEATRKSHDDADNVVRQCAEDNLDALLSRPTAWNATYRRLEAFKQHHGHCNVRRNVVDKEELAKMDPEEKALGCFVGKCRADARRLPGHPDRLEWYKKAALDRLGFEWDPKMKQWMEKYDELRAYKREHGDCNLPSKHNGLGLWVSRQRRQYRLLQKGEKSEMTPDRIALLNELSFDWNLDLRPSVQRKEKQAWDAFYCQLCNFHRIHGHTLVPKCDGDDKAFYKWVQYQRVHMRRFDDDEESNLSEDQVERLRAIHFYYGQWNDIQWMGMYLQLRAYYSLFGTSIVADINREHTDLVEWVRLQRYQLGKWIQGKKGGMTAERASLLRGLRLDPSVTSEAVYEEEQKRRKNVSDELEIWKESRGVETKNIEKSPMEQTASPSVSDLSHPPKRQRVSVAKTRSIRGRQMPQHYAYHHPYHHPWWANYYPAAYPPNKNPYPPQHDAWRSQHVMAQSMPSIARGSVAPQHVAQTAKLGGRGSGGQDSSNKEGKETQTAKLSSSESGGQGLSNKEGKGTQTAKLSGSGSGGKELSDKEGKKSG